MRHIPLKAAFLVFFFLIASSPIYAECTVTFGQDDYAIGETVTATMSCSVPNERNQLYNLTWRDHNNNIIQLNSGTTPGTTGQVFFETYQVQSGVINGTATLTGVNLEGSDFFNVVDSNITLIIQNVEFRPNLWIGQSAGISFQVFDGDNLSVNGAYCTVAIEDGITLAPIYAVSGIHYVVSDYAHVDIQTSFLSFKENSQYLAHITCNYDTTGDGLIDKFGDGRFPFSINRWLDVNTVVDKPEYMANQEIFVCANVTNIDYPTRVSMDILHQVRCSAGNDSDSDLDRVLVMSDDNIPDKRGISTNLTQMQCKRFLFPKPRYMQGQNSSCYASTVVTVLNEENQIAVTYATTSPEFKFISDYVEINPEWLITGNRMSTTINLSAPEYVDYAPNILGNMDINLYAPGESIYHDGQYHYDSIDIRNAILSQKILSIDTRYCNGTPLSYTLEFVSDGQLELELIDVLLNNETCVLADVTFKGDENMLAIVLMFLIGAILFGGLAAINDRPTSWGSRLRWAGMILAFIQILMMVGAVYGNYVGANISALLFVNLWIVILIGFGLFMLTMFFKMIEIMNPEDGKKSERDKDKW